MLWAASMAVAQSPASTTADPGTSIGLIVYAEGSEITILQGGVRRSLDVTAGEALGEPLFVGDQLSTGPHTFAEIQLLTGTNIVRLSENTTVTLSELNPSGRTAVDMTFGRIRSRVDRLAGGGRFEVRGATVVAGVRGTEFGYDQVVDPVTGAVTNAVYALEGEVEVNRASIATEPAESDALIVSAGQAVVLNDGAVSAAQSLVTVPIPEETLRFWSQRPFAREPESPEALFVEFPEVVERVARSGRTLPDSLRMIAEQASSDRDVPVPDASAEDEAPADARQAPRVTVEEAPGAPRPAAAADQSEEARARISFLRSGGAVLIGAGLAADLAAVALYFLGEDLFTGWADFGDPLVTWLGIGGSGSIGLGVLLSLVGDLVR